MSNDGTMVREQAKPASTNPRRPRRGSYKPRPETLALLKVSGNPINGLGEAEPPGRRHSSGILLTSIHTANCK